VKVVTSATLRITQYLNSFLLLREHFAERSSCIAFYIDVTFIGTRQHLATNFLPLIQTAPSGKISSVFVSSGAILFVVMSSYFLHKIRQHELKRGSEFTRDILFLFLYFLQQENNSKGNDLYVSSVFVSSGAILFVLMSMLFWP
jgi:Ca2+/Na+ antiporter